MILYKQGAKEHYFKSKNLPFLEKYKMKTLNE
jgi:hypothetical protein